MSTRKVLGSRRPAQGKGGNGSRKRRDEGQGSTNTLKTGQGTDLMGANNAIVVFQGKNIRRAYHNNEWWFSVFDIVSILSDSADARQYVKKMRSRDPVLNANWGTICTPLELLAPDGKKRETNCVNTEGAFRLIQSIPSPKAEPFK